MRLKVSTILLHVFLWGVMLLTSCADKTYNLSDYGLKPNSEEDNSALFATALQSIISEHKGSNKPLRIVLEPGRYDFHPEHASVRAYYISNHDQTNPKLVGLPFENMENMIFDGQGSELIFHGRMLPISLINSTNCEIKNLSIDFENPHISQVKVLENDTVNHAITFEVAPWVSYEIREGVFVAKGKGWEHTPSWGIPFEEDTKRIVYRAGDIGLGVTNLEELSPRLIKSSKWSNPRLVPGTVIAMRSYNRPTPGVFLANNTDTNLENITVHYSEGMGLLAQMCENITLDRLCSWSTV